MPQRTSAGRRQHFVENPITRVGGSVHTAGEFTPAWTDPQTASWTNATVTPANLDLDVSQMAGAIVYVNETTAVGGQVDFLLSPDGVNFEAFIPVDLVLMMSAGSSTHTNGTGDKVYTFNVSAFTTLRARLSVAITSGTVAVRMQATSAWGHGLIYTLNANAADPTLVTIEADPLSIAKAEDSAHADGDVGVPALTVRSNTAASTSGTNGDYQPIISNTRGATWVAIEDGAGGQITTFGGGTQYTEGDTDASITGTAVMWEDSSDILRAVSVAKPLPVQIASGGTAATVTEVLTATAFDLQAAPYSATTAISGDYQLSLLEMHFTSTQTRTITVTTSAGAVLFKRTADTSTDLTVDFENASFDDATDITVAITQTAGACNLTLRMTIISGALIVGPSVSITGPVDTELTTADLDTGAGTDTRAVIGIVGSASGGGQLIPGTATDGLLVNLGANNDITVNGTVSTAPLTGSTSSFNWTSATALNTAVTFGTASMESVVVSVDETLPLSGGEISFYVSVDGSTNFQQIVAMRPIIRMDVANHVVGSGDSIYSFQVGGFSAFRIQLTTVITGGGSVDVRAFGGPGSQGVLYVRASDGEFAINDGGNVITVDGTVAATQSGTWTVQPGNTANTTPWLASIHDGTTKATVRELGVNDALNVAIVDGSGAQITSFGGGTQYTEDVAAAGDPVGTVPILVRKDTPATITNADGDNVAQRGTNYGAAYVQVVTSSGSYVDSFGGGSQYAENTTQAAITGTAILWEDTSDVVRTVSAAKPLPVDTELPAAAALADGAANPTTPTVGTGSLVFNGTTWDRAREVVNGQNTTGTGILATGILGHYDDASTSSVTENQFAPARISSRRSLNTEGGWTALATQTFNGAPASLTIQCEGLSSCNFTTVTSTPDAASFTFEVSTDGTTWAYIPFVDLTSGDGTPGTQQQVVTGGQSVNLLTDHPATCAFQANVAGWNQCRINSTLTVSSGSWTVKARCSATPVSNLVYLDTAQLANDLTASGRRINVNPDLTEAADNTTNSSQKIPVIAAKAAASTTTNEAWTSTRQVPLSVLTSGQLRIDQSMVAGTATDANTGNASAGTQRVVLASNQPIVSVRVGDGSLNTSVVDETGASAVDALAVGGGTPHDSVDSGNPLKVGGKAASALPTAVASGDRANFITDLFGRLLTAHIDPAMQVWKQVEYTTAQSPTAAVVWDPASGKKIAITYISITTGGTTPAVVTLWFGATGDTTFSQGTDQVVFRGEFAPSSTSRPTWGATFPHPIVAATADHNLMITTSANLTIYVTIYGYEF